MVSDGDINKKTPINLPVIRQAFIDRGQFWHLLREKGIYHRL
jgi:hypothetical protein